VVVKQCSISARPDSIIMRSEGTLCEVFIMFNVSFIATCVKKDSTSKLTSRSVGRSRSF